MNNAVAPLASEAAIPSRVPEAARGFDLYRTPHKGLRFILCHLLVEMGRVSFGDERQASLLAARMEAVLLECDRHIEHEDTFIRPALVLRTPKALTTLDEEHEQHARQVAELRAMAKALAEAANGEHRAATGRTLYLHFSVFVAETLAHMAYEERMVQPLLDRHFTLEEQLGFHAAIVASIPPEEMMAFLSAAIPASSQDERFEILNGARQGMPAPAFAGLLPELLPLLPEADREDLRSRLGVVDEASTAR